MMMVLFLIMTIKSNGYAAFNNSSILSPYDVCVLFSG